MKIYKRKMINETEQTKTQEIKFIDVFGNELKKVYCSDCNKDITTITHHKKGLCLLCAIKKGLIK